MMRGSSGGKTYEVSGETTEWEDILIKKKVLTREEVLINKGLNPSDFEKEDQEEIIPVQERSLENATLDELEELEDELNDDNMLEKYRQQRIEEMKSQALRDRFGEVYDISRDVWIREVTESSESCWVVVHLYQDSVSECRLMHEMLEAVANKYKYVKFIRIQSTQAVENWPDRNLPTLFLYKEGVLKDQMITLRPMGGKTTRDLARWLATKSVLELDPDQVEDDDEYGRTNIKIQQKKAYRRSGQEGYDSDS